MKNYVSPVILDSDEMAEGVYATGSGNCYSVTISRHQIPQTGRGDFRFQVNAHHDAGHNSSEQILVVKFTAPVEYSSSNGTYLSGSGTDTIRIRYNYWNNRTDNIGLGDVCVIADVGTDINEVETYLECNHNNED
ncbi:MAG: hypothetical protein IKP88_03400 [Lachnospiraceae bacterium]|nr:hypothetical protein [Lachnospiraceae bacterium]